jgi:hypothetical protein
VLPHPALEVVRDTGVDRARRARQNVHKVIVAHRCPLPGDATERSDFPMIKTTLMENSVIPSRRGAAAPKPCRGIPRRAAPVIVCSLMSPLPGIVLPAGRKRYRSCGAGDPSTTLGMTAIWLVCGYRRWMWGDLPAHGGAGLTVEPLHWYPVISVGHEPRRSRARRAGTPPVTLLWHPHRNGDTIAQLRTPGYTEPTGSSVHGMTLCRYTACSLGSATSGCRWAHGSMSRTSATISRSGS